MQKLLYLLTICPFTLSCAFSSSNKSIRLNSFNGTTPWFQRKLTHTGRELSDKELIYLSSLSDEEHFRKVLSPIMVPRVVATPSHAKVRRHLVSEMKSLGWTVEEDQFEDLTPHGQKIFTNVIATLDTSAQRRLVLACHYDSKLTPTGFIGAIDSAVPCAMLLNLATILKSNLNAQRAKKMDLTVQFIFFDGEEAFVQWSGSDSLYGSRKLAQRLHDSAFPSTNNIGTTELHRMDLFVLLDLIGTYDTRFHSLFRDTDNWFESFQAFEKRSRNLGILSNRPEIFKDRKMFGAAVEDDHIPFLRKGVPILHLISVPFPSVWHKIGDNELALHYPTIKDMNLILRAFVVDYLSLPL